MRRNLPYLLLALLSFYLPVNAQLVTLSPGFGQNNGFSYTNLQAIAGTTIAQRAWSVMSQPDGKIILAGESATASILLRFNEDGSPDLTFGVDGKAIVFAGKMGKAILQPDGKILMTIPNTGDFTLVRYNSNGTPDLSFGNRGIAILQVGFQSSYQADMLLQPDGKIVSVGYADYFVAGLGYNLVDAAVARFTADGQPDISFDGDGKVLVAVESGSDAAQAVALDLSDPAYPTGKIVIGGYCSPAGARRIFTARLLPDGSLDNSYGTAGLVKETFTNNGYISNIKIFADGKIIAGGTSYSNSTFTFDLLLLKYNTNGSRDLSFSGDGLTIKPSGTSLTAAPVKEMQLLADGKLVVVSGRSGGSPGSFFAISRYLTDGSLDNSFDGDGVVPANFINTSFDEVNSIAVDNNGRYLVAGESMTNYGKNSLALNRYTVAGSLDPSFTGDGKYLSNSPGSIDNGRHIIRQPDGKLLVVATVVRLGDVAPVQNISDYAIMRYNSNGTPDVSWGTNGVKFAGITPSGENVRLALQADGKVLLAGQGNNNVTVARFTTTGAADVSFDGDGKISFTSIGGYVVGNPAGIAVASDGKILVTCSAVYNSTSEIGLIKLNTNGSLDVSYGAAGLARVGLGGPVGMLMLPNDKVMLTVTNNPQGNLKRILANGTQDATFNNNGTVNIISPANSAPQLLSLTTDAVGNVLVCGTANMAAAGFQAFLARVTPAGMLDATFGTNGVKVTSIVPGTDELFSSVNVQANGSIIAAGTIRRAYNDMDLLVVRFSANGVQDGTLNNNTGYYSPDLQTGSFDQANSFVQVGSILYGTGNIRTDLNLDLLVLAIDVNTSVLPVKFSSFTARAQNAASILQWTVQLEQNLKHYSVERSTNGIQFYPLAMVAVKHANSSGNSYSYVDAQPMPGINYYRIQGIDLDGTTSATAIKTVSFGAPGLIKIFPNPAQDDLQILLNGSISFPVELNIYDATGRLVYAKKASAAASVIDIRQFGAGIYYVYAGKTLAGSFLKN